MPLHRGHRPDVWWTERGASGLFSGGRLHRQHLLEPAWLRDVVTSPFNGGCATLEVPFKRLKMEEAGVTYLD